MDLSKNHPRSVHEKMLGVVQLARTVDKSKADLAGTLGEYDYNCGMDQHVFEFLGIDAAKMTEIVKNAKSDSDIEAALKPSVDKKSPDEIAKFNKEWVDHKPEGASLQYFLQLREKIAPSRSDVTSWPDLLDLDEGRPVPQRLVAV
ncbi:MAG: DUF5069 domain-containing protein [Candidatus Eremiobacteraeota bacterium]|nr:DUF5069 domain-containing protein [Candidatus Eremiobacteraeota bacterium]